jgi:hypothetical protein
MPSSGSTTSPATGVIFSRRKASNSRRVGSRSGSNTGRRRDLRPEALLGGLVGLGPHEQVQMPELREAERGAWRATPCRGSPVPPTTTSRFPARIFEGSRPSWGRGHRPYGPGAGEDFRSYAGASSAGECEVTFAERFRLPRRKKSNVSRVRQEPDPHRETPAARAARLEVLQGELFHENPARHRGCTRARAALRRLRQAEAPPSAPPPCSPPCPPPDIPGRWASPKASR